MRNASSGHLRFRFILLLLCICSAAADDMERHQDLACNLTGGCFDFETNIVHCHQLQQHKVLLETITERSHRLRQDYQSFQGLLLSSSRAKIIDALARSRSRGAISEQSQSSSSSKTAAAAAGMARVEASYRSLSDAVDRLREMQNDDDVPSFEACAPDETTHKLKLAQEELKLAQEELIAHQDEELMVWKELSAAPENVLHMAILADSQSRFIRTFVFYYCAAFPLYMLTSAKETFRIRRQLYLGLCATMMLEAGVTKLGADDDYGTQLSNVLLIRSVSFAAAAAVHIMHSVVTHKRG